MERDKKDVFMSSICDCCGRKLGLFNKVPAGKHTVCQKCYDYGTKYTGASKIKTLDELRCNVYRHAPNGYFPLSIEAQIKKYLEEKQEAYAKEKQERIENKYSGYELKYQYTEVGIFSPKKHPIKVYFELENRNVELRKEPSNKFDENAVAVVYSDGNTERVIGYLNRGTIQDTANRFLSNGWIIDAKIDSLIYFDDDDYRMAGNKGTFFTLGLNFYQPIEGDIN